MKHPARLLIVAALAVAAFVAIPAATATTGTLVITSSTTLTGHHQGSIVVDADGITLDCAGYTVSGPGTAGVDLGIIIVSHVGVTVKNCVVTGFATGIGLFGASNAEIRGNVVSGQSGNGVVSNDGADNSFRSNQVAGNGAHGIVIGSSTGGSVLSNTVSGNGRGGVTILAQSSGLSVASNFAHHNGWSGIVVVGSSNNSLRDNRTDDNSQSGISIQGSTTGTDSDNNVLTGNTATRNAWFGIDLAYFSAIIDGDPSSAAFSNTLKGNTANQNGMSGFGVFGDSSLNMFQGNRARNNAAYDGLDASTGSANTWTNNNFGTTSGI